MSSSFEESISIGPSCAKSSAAAVWPFREGSVEAGFAFVGRDGATAYGLGVVVRTISAVLRWVITEIASAAAFPAAVATASSAPAAESAAAVASLTCWAANCVAALAARSFSTRSASAFPIRPGLGRARLCY